MTAETKARVRTRRAILDAAVSVLAKNPAASLADVAAAAAVGRTTIHRYFAERSDLLTAIGADVLDKIAAATDRSRLAEGPALEAVARLCSEYFDLGENLTLVFNVPEFWDWEGWEQETAADRALIDLVQRGQAAGEIDRALDPVWIQHLIWCMLYAAWSHVHTNGASKHESLTQCLRSLTKAIAA
ncbi:TetR/AcrR family transcriptional regulator [Actinomadura fulvescens]|uniref:TetR/AcrR family transcriptional regulator n=1 Tax=Actinomadura fulvescens TaxID=46160 RepID=A0ABN3PGD6_9ACTN